MTTVTGYIFYIKGKELKITKDTFMFIRLFSERAIPRKFYEYIIRHDPNIQKFKEETGYAWRSLYVWILSAYENNEYKRLILWYKVLAVKTFAYTRGVRERHIECRFLTDAPDQIAVTSEFSRFCENCIDRFMECMGYTDFIANADKIYYKGVQKIDEFEDKEDRKVPFYVEIFDYECDRYPFEAEGVFSPFYWHDYVKAVKEFEDQACPEVKLGPSGPKLFGEDRRQSKLNEFVCTYYCETCPFKKECPVYKERGGA